MADSLDRDTMIDLLERLGSADDNEALEAARALHAHISAADAHWDDLLAPAVGGALGRGDAGTESSEKKSTNPVGGRDADTLALIEQLLAMPDRSEALREELEEYKLDIANGEFAARDHQYVRALHQRLTK